MDNNLIYNMLLLLLVVVVYFPLPIISQICTETVIKVSECLSDTSEFEKWASEKCSKACENSSERGYQFKYHCMWDSTHRELLEMCATPKLLFGFCPAYDLKGPQIQKDKSRPCKTSSSRTYYNSDEMFFCDLTNCLESPTSTTSDRPSEKPDMSTTQMSDGGSWHHHLLWIPAIIAVISLIIGLIIFIRKRQQSSESSNCFKNLTPDCWKSPTKGIKKNEQIEDSVNIQELLSGTGDNVAIIV